MVNTLTPPHIQKNKTQATVFNSNWREKSAAWDLALLYNPKTKLDFIRKLGWRLRRHCLRTN